MKRLLIVLICILSLLGMSWSTEQETAQDEKPPITKPYSIEEES